MNRSQFMYALRLIATILVVVVSVVYLYAIRDKLSVLSQVSVGDLVVITALVVAFFVLTGWVFALLVRLIGIDLTLFEAVGLSFITSFGNYLGPARPGAVMKAMYLKSVRRMPYTHFASVFLANNFLGFLMTGTAGLLGLLVTWHQFHRSPLVLVLVCTALIVVFLIPFLLRMPALKSKRRIVAWFISALDGFNTIARQRGKLVVICIAMLAQYLLSALLFMVAFRALGLSIGFWTAFVMGVFNTISNFFSVTPNNIGIQEAVSGCVAAMAGQDFSNGVLATGVIRVVHMGLSFGTAPYFTHTLLRRGKSQPLTPADEC